MTRENRDVAVAFWQMMNARDWDAAALLLADDVVVEWPHTRERFRGRAAFIAMNRAYPGDWRITVQRAAAVDDEILTVVAVTEGDSTHHAVSFFTVRDGRIHRAVEYWSGPESPPEWRTAPGWSERY